MIRWCGDQENNSKQWKAESSKLHLYLYGLQKGDKNLLVKAKGILLKLYQCKNAFVNPKL